MHLQGLDHVALSVRDVEHSAQWYSDVLGFERQHEGMWNGIPIFVGKDNLAIALFPTRGNEISGRSSHSGPSILHFAFRTDHVSFLAAQQELKKRAIQFEFQDHEVSHSIYFRDPDGHEIEITTYELG
jgi:catechol 2,3-dioxygenase-like lactoylglutathione lyase family enzyme